MATLLALASPLFAAGCSEKAGGSSSTDASARAAELVGAEGDVTLTNATSVNAYAALATDVAAGSSTLVLAAGGAARFTAGDLALVLQAQGASINATDDATYGSVTALNGAGHYELIHVTAVSVATNTLTVTSPGLRFGYSAAGRTQVIRVPQYRNLTVGAAGRISAPAWNGVTGGVVAVHVRDTLTLDGSVDVSGLGFRGGAVRTTTDNSILNIALYRSDQPINGGAKGEGIAGFGAEYDVLNGRYGRGAPANAGGGGNAHNAGGGGGANVAAMPNLWNGQGIMDLTVTGGAAAWPLDPGYIANGNAPTQSPGGGRGGYTYSNSNQNALVLGPGQAAWLGDSRRERGGLGGRPLAADPLQRLFFGGGGGAGDANNAHGGSGGAGAGIVIVIAHRITGAGQILAQGSPGGGAATAPNDAPGGGGGGGSVLLLSEQIDGVQVAAPGGVGGSQTQDQTVPETEGPGGGGGGGLVASHGGLATANVNGAAGGTTDAPALTEFPSNGSTRGQAGVATPVADAWGDVINLPGDLSVTVSNGAALVAPGASTSYTITVSNAGPNAIPRATLATTAGGTVSLGSVSWTCAAGTSSACAAATGTGLPSTTFDIAPGDTVTFVVTGTVNAGAASGTTTLTATVAPPTGYDDPNGANNSATDTDNVAPLADLSTTVAAVPSSVITLGNVLLQVGVANAGPSAASGVTSTVMLSPGIALVSATGTGWSCTLGNALATCTRTTLASGASAPLEVVVKAPATTGTSSAVVAIGSTTSDPQGSNNSASINFMATANTLPTTTSDVFSVPANSTNDALDVLANDSTAPDLGEVLTITAVSAAVHGTLTINGGGTGLLYTPLPGFSGVDMATYTVDDGHGGTALGMVTINVLGGGGGGAGGAGGGSAGGAGASGGAGNQAGAGGTGASGGAGNQGGAGATATGGAGNQAGANGGNGASGGGAGQGANGGAGNAGGNGGTQGTGSNATGGSAGSGNSNQGGAGAQAGAGAQGGAGAQAGAGAQGGAGAQAGAGGHGAQGGAGVLGGGAAGGEGGEPSSGGGAGGNGLSDVNNDGLLDDGISVRGGGCSCDTAPSPSPSLALTVGAAALLLLARRRRASQAPARPEPVVARARSRRASRRAVARSRAGTAIVLGLLLAGGVALAQTAQPDTAIPIERFRWSIDRQGLLNVEWGRTPDATTFNLGLWGTYADDPLVITRTADKVRLGSLVHQRVDGALVAAFAPLDHLQIGLAVPLIAYQKGQQDIPGATVSTLPKIGTVGIGDVIVMPKIGLYRGDDDGFSVALMPTVGIPSSQGKDYFGEKSLWLAPELDASFAVGGFRMAGNVGYHWRKNHPQLADLKVDDEVFGLLGMGLRFGPKEGRHRPLELDLTASGASSKENLFHGRNRNPVEADAALQIDFVEAFTFMVGGGLGLLPGFGDPDYRLFAGLRLNILPPPPAPVDDDPDKDGIRGTADRCPIQPEDKDHFQDRDGCPDPDNDKDGVLDVDDKCPNVRGPKENQGCPDNDRDDDGLVDRLDKCPDDAEDKDDFEDEDGCPDPDNDKDGVLDTKDKCPNEPGPRENQGCPDKDRDGDGIIDRLDNCPDEPGDAANNGCKKKQLARITEHGIEILDTVYFATDKAVIQKKSFRLLDNVAAVILAHPEAGTIRVEGHTDSQGDDNHNQDLSDRRAAAVLDYLVKRGVAQDRLRSKGYGETQPIADNKTRAGRAKNRRVVFVIENAGAGIEGSSER